ncbi:stalk domain-containing protein [Alkalihalobacterium elongatum]|uniref:stalk domain-containing protein n=1 Tax=Alkalihalobacterium elongatum TaxID=2675466 RepID=UPI001C1F52BC|nr:stalk domain-containing protein [Alkalihalobacterium elongatum]
MDQWDLHRHDIASTANQQDQNTVREIYHTVVSGDTIWKLSLLFGTTVQAIKPANNLTTDVLLVGQVLFIPVSQPVAEPIKEQAIAQPQPVAIQPTIQQPTTQPIPAKTTVKPAKVGTQVIARVNVNVANIRRSATTNSAIVGKVRSGQNITILGRTGNFYRIQSGKTRGFIHANLLTLNQTLSANGQIAVVINGKVANVQGNPLSRNKTVYVPLKGTVENLKMTYSWSKTTNAITVRDTKTTINMNVNSKKAKVNRKNITLTRHPEILHSRVYVLIRTLNETLSTKSHWNSKNKIVGFINKGFGARHL